jgi:hypothetical protein
VIPAAGSRAGDIHFRAYALDMKSKRVEVRLSAKQLQSLQRLSSRTGLTRPTLIKYAIARLLAWWR